MHKKEYSSDWIALVQKIAHLGIWDQDPVSNELWWSDETYRILGLEPRSIPPNFEQFLSIVHPDDRSLIVEKTTLALNTDKIPFKVDYRILRPDHNTRIIHEEAVIERDIEGNPLKITGIIQDITDREQARKERKKLQEQLIQAQKMESVGRLAGGIAHDFNNMLGVILGRVAMALGKVDHDPSLRVDLREIQSAARRSAEVTRQLLAFARKQTIVPMVINLNRTIANMLMMLRRLIGEDINLTWLPDKQIWPVKMDPSQLDQILANLSVNARDAIDGVGKLTIETGKVTFDEDYCAVHQGFSPGEFVQLVVSDTGCGMDKKILNNIFDPFFTTKDTGTGLGLATVYGIIKQNKGFINVYSEQGKGTSFKIYLPRHTGSGRQVRIKKQVVRTAPGNETIMLVEDEPSMLEMTTLMLEEIGYSVIAATTPKEAINMASEYDKNIHLLLTDVIMPGMNGRDLSKKLRQFYPNLECLFMSGYTDNVIAHHGVLDEGVYFIPKPFSMQDLSVKLREVLDAVKDTFQ